MVLHSQLRGVHIAKLTWPPRGVQSPYLSKAMAAIEENRSLSLYALAVGTALAAALWFGRGRTSPPPGNRFLAEPSADSLLT
ncbi:hypothetical protein niasHT_018963 [Heterodera trifolii]|uniref:Uncharacterized protein n=1 Tax=Heterodera trifolii TaxID=157864 RepID=A0ABD2LDN7_9BILA